MRPVPRHRTAGEFSSSPLKKAAGKGMVMENPMTQQRESEVRPSPGARFSLRDFTGEGRPVGVPPVVRLLWMLVSRSLTMKWWCPNQLRVLVLRAFGARIGTGTRIKFDVKIDWPWKLEIGNDTWIGESVWIINAVAGGHRIEYLHLSSSCAVQRRPRHIQPYVRIRQCADFHRRFGVDRCPGDDMRGVLVSDGVTSALLVGYP